MTTYYLPKNHPLMVEYKQFVKDHEYFAKHWDALKAKYADCYVAVFKGRVRAASPDHEIVVDELRRKGVPPGRAAIHLIAEKRKMVV